MMSWNTFWLSYRDIGTYSLSEEVLEFKEANHLLVRASQPRFYSRMPISTQRR